MIAFLFVLFVIGPILEIYLLLTAGSAFGALPVVAACIATAVIGGAILRAQGLAALANAQHSVQDGKVPVEAVADGVFLVVAAPLLMTPGFVTDALGFLLLVPPVRHAIARMALTRLRARIARGDASFTVRRY